MSIINYPVDPAQERLIPAEALREFVRQLLVKNRMFPADAEIAADRMTEADLRGLVSHGSRALERYLPSMEMCNIDPRAQMLTESETPAAAVLNGGQGLGHVAATKGMQLAIAKAKEVGTGTVVVKKSHHYGACGVYALLAAVEGLIGYTTTTAGLPNVIVPGSTGGGETNHGLAWACPNPAGPPIVLDMAVAECSWGKLQTLAEYGLPIPAHWAWDESRTPTTDPHQAKWLMPAAGPRGFGLAFFSSLLTSGLSGARLAIERTRAPDVEGGEHFFYAIDPDKFVERAQLEQRLQAAVEKIRALPPADGFDRVTLPGELEAEQAERALSEGIPLHREHVATLEKLAQQHRVEIPWN
jgi:ureidoglycolate dehydrogenase (NAD+)